MNIFASLKTKLIFTLLLAFGPMFANSLDYREILNSPVVINLQRHFFRYEATKDLMEKAGFTNITRFDAIDGFYTDETFFNHMNIFGGNKGQKGCAASHLSVWENFANEISTRKFLFVCEDDMLPHSDFEKIFPIYWNHTKEDFDLILVGNQMIPKKDNLVLREPAFCLHAYIISKRGAKRLCNLYKNLPKNSGDLHIIDIFLVRAMFDRKIDYFCYNGKTYPDLINQDKGLIWHGRNTGICFQNKSLGSTIHCPDIVP